jgi:hypothetical protein
LLVVVVAVVVDKSGEKYWRDGLKIYIFIY